MKYEVKIYKDVLYRENGQTSGPASQTLDLYIPQGKKDFPLLFFIHGGGFMHYDWTKDSYSSYCLHLAEAGIAAAAPNYRLFPEMKGFPDRINRDYCKNGDQLFDGIADDAALAMSFAKKRLAETGDFSGDVFLAGHSAGAYLAMMLFYREKYLGAYGIDPSSLRGVIFASGQPTTHFIRLYSRGLDPRLTLIDDASPMYYLKPMQVPQLITIAENDMKNRLLQTQVYLASLNTIGYPGNIEFIEYRGRGHDNCIVPDAEAPEEPCALHYDTLKFINRYAK